MDLKVRNEVIRGKTRVTQTVVERLENNVLKRYGSLARMEDNRWPKRIMIGHRQEDDGEDDRK
jgi:hypothetical protein